MKSKLKLIVFLILLISVVGNKETEAKDIKVTGIQNPVLTLNGTWKFSTTPPAKFWENNVDSKSWADIEVPGEWTMQGFEVTAGERAGYFREFDIPEDWKNHTIYLKCDAVFSQAELWVNGREAGEHIGPMVAFEKEITELVKFGKSNRISMGIISETMADTLMSGTQYAAHQLGGILRKIYLYAVPKVHLTELVIQTKLDKEYVNADLKITGILKNDARVKDAEISVRLFNPTGKEIDLENGSKSISLSGEVKKEVNLSLNIDNPFKWDAEHPNLYKLELKIKSDAGEEIIYENIGFREIEVVGNQLFVNGKPIKLKGVNRHEVHPLRGRSLTPELWKKDAELFKAANVNYIRTSHYPPSEEFIDWCDKIGLYVELENPICWVGHHANEHWKSNDPKNPQLYSYFEDVAVSNIAFFRNHPSIIIWSMVNESMWTNNWSKLADFYAKIDPSRPATFHDQAYGGFNNYGSTKMPVANIHYPGTAGPDIAQDFDRPLLFGEYAHLNTYNRVEIVTDPGVRDAWGRGFKKMWEGMYKSRGCLGGAIWSGIDDVFYLPDGRAVGYGEWGPIDGWRRQKPEYYHMKKTYSPVKIHNRYLAVPQNGEPIRLQFENRFDFTNLNECIITWEIDGRNGQVQMNLAPHQIGILDINTGSTKLDGEILTVRVISPQSIEVEACAIEIGDVKRDDFPFEKIAQSSIKSTEDKDILKIEGNDFEWEFNLKEGRIDNAQVNGNMVLKKGAELMMLDLTSGPCDTEHSLEIPLHNSLCSGKTVKYSEWKESNDTIIIHVQLSYDQAEGDITYEFTDNGKLIVNYNLKSKVEMNPRQWGIVFTSPEKNSNLQWYRKGLWSWYPESHIGRTNGKAVPFGDKAFLSEAFGQAPENQWRYDANQLGTNDFRATRENIYWAALTNNNGVGVTVLSDGKQAFRSYVNDQNDINFLVADYSTGGGDIFFSGHYKDERKKLVEGSVIKGSVKLQLVKGK